MQIARMHPEVVRKVVLASVSYNYGGFHPGLVEGLDALQPEWLDGTPFQQEYASIAPDPQHFATFVAKNEGTQSQAPRLATRGCSGDQSAHSAHFRGSDIIRLSTL